MRWLRSIDWGAIVGSALALAFGLLVIVPFAQSPEQKPYQHASSQTPDDPWWDRSGFWEAFFTGLIAIYAVRQFAESQKASVEQLALTKRSSDAAVAAEMPVVFLHELAFLTPEPPLGPVPRRPIEGVPPLRSSVVMWFKNYGRTPARVTEIVCQHLVVDKLPAEPRYSIGAPVRTGIVLEPSKEAIDFDSPSTFAITEAQQTAIANDAAQFWVYGYIGYRDFLGEPHQSRFCYSWFVVDPGDTADTAHRFAEGGPEIYRRST